METKLKIFFNPSYTVYNDQSSYLIFLSTETIYLVIDKSISRLLQKPTEHITKDNIDDYALSRDFTKILELTDDLKVVWNNDFLENKNKIKNTLKIIQFELYQKMKYKLIRDADLVNVFSLLKVIVDKEN